MTTPVYHRFAAAPSPVAPYSHAVVSDGWVFLTGQIPADPYDDSIPAADDIVAQTKRVMDNLVIVLNELQLGLEHVVQSRVYLTRFQDDYAKMNDTYASYFPAERLPARSCIGVTALARDVLVEIDMVARRPD